MSSLAVEPLMRQPVQDLSALVAANHSCSTPETAFFSIEGGGDHYFQWMRGATVIIAAVKSSPNKARR
jgi:hypothetical protein